MMWKAVLTATVLAVLLLTPTPTAAVDRSNFKKCSDAGFCRRLQTAAPDADSYHVMPATIMVANNILTAEVVNEAEVVFLLTVNVPSDGVVRVRLAEKDPLYPRFEATDALVAPAAAAASGGNVVSASAGAASAVFELDGGVEVEVEYTPLRVHVRADGTTWVSLNSRGLLAYEHSRPVPSPEPDTPAAAAYEAEKGAGMWEESWKGTTDSKKHGPQGVGLDIDFPASKHVYGIPEHASPFSLPDTTGDGAKYSDPYRLYNLDVFEYELDNEMALYGSVPFMVAHAAGRSVGVLWLNAAETFVDVSSTPTGRGVHWMSETGNIDVFVMTGGSPAAVLAQYGAVTGTARMPPLFAIAYHQCRWNYKDEDDVRTVDANFDAHNIPYDVIWLDIEHTDGKRYFTWDPVKFPTPTSMIDNVAAKGRKMVTIIDPHIKRDDNYAVYADGKAGGHFINDASANEYDGFCWPGSSAWLDMTSPAVRDYWASLFAYDKYVGSTPALFTWNDMNEPSVFNGPEITMKKDALHAGGWEHRDVHNMYGMFFQRATVGGQLARSGGTERPFVLSRAFFASSQRDGAIWTGDNEAKWSHLEASVPMLLSHSIAGIPFIGADVGGFFGDVEPELLARWYQAGAFQPFFRAHGHLDTKRREPWLFGEPYTSIIRTAIRTRYAYLPYLYTLFAESAATLAPVMRPLWYHHADEAAFDRDSEFLLGSALLVAPATAPGVTTVTAYLPRGLWYDVRSFKPYQGGQLVPLPAPLESIPVLQAAGSIVPKKERARRSSAAMALDPYTLVVALNAAGLANGDLYLDDGHSVASPSTTRRFAFAASTLTASLAPGAAPGYDTPELVERIVVVGMTAPPSRVSTADGTTLSFHVDPATGAVVVRKPDLPVAADWAVTFHH